STGAATSINGSGAGGFSGINNVVGSGNTADTLSNSAATWTVSGADSGTSGATTYSVFANLADAGGGAFNITTGSVSGTIAGGTGSTLSYAGNAGPVSVNLATGAATSINAGAAGGFSGINNVVGSSNAGDTLTNAAASWTVNGADSGASGGTPYSAFANLTDTGAGNFNIANGGSVSGNLDGGAGSALSYATRTGPVTFDLDGRANLSTGVTGTVSGINSVAGSANTGDTITGNNQTYNLTALN